MSKSDKSSLLVQIQSPHGEWIYVGLLARSGETNWFESFPDYWSTRFRPVLGQVFEERGPEWSPSSRVALPTWFSHLLPEGRLRNAVAEAANVKPQREFFLLERVGGDDLPGAVRIAPADVEPLNSETPDEDEQTRVADDEVPEIKFSLAGVQLKFSLRADQRGLTIPTAGQAGDWIAKLPDGRAGFEGVPEAEYAALELARATGIDVPETRLIDVSEIRGLPKWARQTGGRALLIKRFDRRDGNQRVHAEELAQVLDIPTGSESFRYRMLNFETIGSVTSALCGPESVTEVLARIVLNVLVGNGDAHAKNWAYTYPDGRNARLSPAYDIVPTVLYIPSDDLGLKLRGSRSFEDVRVTSFDKLLERSGWEVAAGRRAVRAAVDRVVAVWPTLRKSLAEEAFDRLTTRRDSLPLLRT